MLLFTAETNSKVTVVVNFIPGKFWSLPQRVSKVLPYTDLNLYRESSGGSRFLINSLISGPKKDLFHAPVWFIF